MVSALIQSPISNRPFERTVHHRCRGFPLNFKQRKVDAVREYPIGFPPMDRRKSEEDPIAAPVKHLENAAQAEQIDMLSSLGSISQPQMPTTAFSEDPIAVAAAGNLQAPLKPSENVAQARQIDKLSSLVSALIESPILKTPTKRPFESTIHDQCHGFPLNFKRQKVDAVREFPSGCGALTPRIVQRKSEEDPITAVAAGNSEAHVKPLENAAQAKQIDMLSSLGSLSRPQPPITAMLPPRIDQRRSEEDPLVVAATGNSQAPLKPFENAAQTIKIDMLSSLGSISRPLRHITALLAPQIHQRKSDEEPIAVAATGNSQAPLQPSENASQVKQIDFLNSLGSISRPQPHSTAAEVVRDTVVRTYHPPRMLKNCPVKQDFPAGVGNTSFVSSSKSILAKAKSSAEPGPMEATVITDAKLFVEEIQGRDAMNSTLKENARDECEKNIVGQESNDLIIVSADEDYHRNKVTEALNLFEELFTKLSHERAAKSKVQKGASSSIHITAAMLLKKQQKWVNTSRQFGPISGVDVGDRFHFRAELVLVGLHRPFQGGIDYMKKDGKFLATSIVASGRYANDMDSSDVLIYCGQGGNPTVGDKRIEDQKFERGNLALYNSMVAKNPIRVIRGFKVLKATNRMGSSIERSFTKYIYDGLYIVDEYWQERGRFGKLVFKFQLKRILGQPELSRRIVRGQHELPRRILNKSKKSEVRKGLCVVDISQGKEEMPIRAMNIVDDEQPPSFNYITNMIYPEWYNQSMPSGCDCTDECLNTEKCSCTLKNGGEIPFNNNGAIVKVKPLVYECGPSCKCSSSCNNRVSQHGIRVSLQVFKTESRGWGVRSRNYIPSGSFICEYIGELLQDKELEGRTGNDEYLFEIGTNDNDNIPWDGSIPLLLDPLSSSFEVMDDGGLVIDAAQCGNVGRFINHSCSPNLYAQNVLYDHDDKRAPHIMLFATKNIPPLRELTYDYNYTMGQVCDSNGDIRMKNCYCGSLKYSGRMY